jgi:hypothetical protein
MRVLAVLMWGNSPNAYISYQSSGILIMGVRLTSHWTAAVFTGLLSVPV